MVIVTIYVKLDGGIGMGMMCTYDIDCWPLDTIQHKRDLALSPRGVFDLGLFNYEDTDLKVSRITSEYRCNLEYALSMMSQLAPDWDGYGAPAINKDAIGRASMVLAMLRDTVVINLQVSPTEFGAVQLTFKNVMSKRECVAEFGRTAMSYYVLENGKEPEFHSFLPYTKTVIDKYINSLY